MTEYEARVRHLEERDRAQQVQIDLLLSHAPLMFDLTAAMQAPDKSITISFIGTLLEGATIVGGFCYDASNKPQSGLEITYSKAGSVYTGVKVDFFGDLEEIYKLVIIKLE